MYRCFNELSHAKFKVNLIFGLWHWNWFSDIRFQTLETNPLLPYNFICDNFSCTGTETETDVEKKFGQEGGAKKKGKSKSKAKKSLYKKHFFNDDSDITDKSSSDSKDEFSSSELDW